MTSIAPIFQHRTQTTITKHLQTIFFVNTSLTNLFKVIRSTIGYLLCIINNNKIILVSITNLFENLLRLFEAFYGSLKPSHARASNSQSRFSNK